MSWIALTTDDVLSEFTLQEASSLRNLQGSGSGSGPPFANIDIIVVNVIDEVRGYIIAGGYDVDPIEDDTIPGGLFVDAIAIARWRILISTPMLKQLQTEERRQAFDKAIDKLLLIANRKFTPEPIPDTIVVPRGGNWNSENKLLMRTHPVPPPESQFPPITNEWANPIVLTPQYIAGALYMPSIVALRDDPNSLEALASTRYQTGTALFIVIDLSGSQWQLTIGPADGSDPDGEVQPLDYNLGTNNRHWSKVGGL